MDLSRGREVVMAALALALCAGCNGAPVEGTRPADEKAVAAKSAGTAEPAALGNAARPGAEPAAVPAGAVAVVNGNTIGEERFALALRDAAFGAKSATIKGRREVLDGLVSGALLLQEAQALKLESAPAVQRSVERMRRFNVLRQFSLKIAGESMAVTDEEVVADLGQLPQIIEARVLLVEEREAAEDLLLRIRGGEALPAAAQKRTIYARAGSTMYPEEVEAAIFTMRAGEIAALETPVGNLVVRVDARRELSEEEVSSARGNVRKKLVDARLENGQHKILEDARGRFPVKRLVARFADQPAVTADWLASWRLFDSTPMATVGDVTLTLGDIYRNLGDYEMVRKTRSEAWETVFEEMCRNAIEKTLYYLQARREGFKPTPAAEKNIVAEMEQLLTGEYSARIVLAVKPELLGKEQCGEIFEKGRGKRYLGEERLSVSQILVRRPEQAEKVTARLRAGEDFAQLARSLSLHSSAGEGGGLGSLKRSGLVKLFGEQGAGMLLEKAAAHVVGPLTLHTTSGYHVILTSGYQRRGEGTFEEALPDLLKPCLQDARAKAMAKAVAELRAKARVAVDERKLATIEPAAGMASVHRPGEARTPPPRPGAAGAAPHGGSGFPGAGDGSPHGGSGFPGAGGGSPHGGGGAPHGRP